MNIIEKTGLVMLVYTLSIEYDPYHFIVLAQIVGIVAFIGGHLYVEKR